MHSAHTFFILSSWRNGQALESCCKRDIVNTSSGHARVVFAWHILDFKTSHAKLSGTFVMSVPLDCEHKCANAFYPRITNTTVSVTLSNMNMFLIGRTI